MRKSVLITILAALFLLGLTLIVLKDSRVQDTSSATRIEAQSDPSSAFDNSKYEPELLNAAFEQASDQEWPPQFGEFLNSVDEAVLDPNTVAEFSAGRPMSRYRVVSINQDVFRNIVRGNEQEFQLPLFDDTILNLSAYSMEEYVSGPRNGMASWMGRDIDDDNSAVSLVVGPDGHVIGNIKISDGIYEIQATDTLPYHFIFQWDPKHTYTYE